MFFTTGLFSVYRSCFFKRNIKLIIHDQLDDYLNFGGVAPSRVSAEAFLGAVSWPNGLGACLVLLTLQWSTSVLRNRDGGGVNPPALRHTRVLTHTLLLREASRFLPWVTILHFRLVKKFRYFTSLFLMTFWNHELIIWLFSKTVFRQEIASLPV